MITTTVAGPGSSRLRPNCSGLGEQRRKARPWGQPNWPGQHAQRPRADRACRREAACQPPCQSDLTGTRHDQGGGNDDGREHGKQRIKHKPKVLISAASRHAATAEIAQATGEALSQHGFATTVMPPDEVGAIKDCQSERVAVSRCRSLAKWDLPGPFAADVASTAVTLGRHREGF